LDGLEPLSELDIHVTCTSPGNALKDSLNFHAKSRQVLTFPRKAYIYLAPIVNDGILPYEIHEEFGCYGRGNVDDDLFHAQVRIYFDAVHGCGDRVSSGALLSSAMS
jgi:hypothetical protein